MSLSLGAMALTRYQVANARTIVYVVTHRVRQASFESQVDSSSGFQLERSGFRADPATVVIGGLSEKGERT